MKAKVIITLKNGVLDPQGSAIESTLDHMGFAGVNARVGKFIELEVKETDAAKAKKAQAAGIPAVALFPVVHPSRKSDDAREAFNDHED